MQLFCHIFLIWILFLKFLYSHTPEWCKLYVVISTWAFEDLLWSCCHLSIDSVKGEMASVIIPTVSLLFQLLPDPTIHLVLGDGFIQICNYPFCRNWIFNIWRFLSKMWKICSIRLFLWSRSNHLKSVWTVSAPGKHLWRKRLCMWENGGISHGSSQEGSIRYSVLSAFRGSFV